MYCMVVLQRVICMLRVMCGGVAACHKYGLWTLWCCGSVSFVWCVYCVIICPRVICMFCFMCGGVAACHMYDVCTVCWFGSVS